MGATGKKLLNHPDLDEIMSRCRKGESVRSIEKWLKEKYPDSPEFTANKQTIQKFRQTYLDLEGEALDKVKTQHKEERQIEQKQEAIEKLRQNPGYQSLVSSMADKVLSVKDRMIALDKIINDRIQRHLEHSPDAISLERDKQLVKWIQEFRYLLQDWSKLVEGKPDKTIEHNVNISMVDNYAVKIKEAVRDVLAEIEPSKVQRFLELCERKLSSLKEPDPNKEAKDFFNTATALDAKYSEPKEN